MQVFPHPALALLGSFEDNFASKYSPCPNKQNNETAAANCSPNGRLQTTEKLDSPMHSGAFGLKEPSFRMPVTEHSSCDSRSRINSGGGNDHPGSPSLSSEPASLLRTPATSTCCPLEIQAYGGVGHLPLSWTIPRAFIAHGIHFLGLEHTLPNCWTVLEEGQPTSTPHLSTPLKYPKRPQTRFSKLRNAKGNSRVGNMPEGNAAKRRCSDGSTNTQDIGTTHFQNVLVHRVRDSPQAPTDEKLYQDTNRGCFSSWTDDVAVEPIFVIPSICITKGIGGSKHCKQFPEVLPSRLKRDCVVKKRANALANMRQPQVSESQQALEYNFPDTLSSPAVEASEYEGLQAKVSGKEMHEHARLCTLHIVLAAAETSS